MNYVVWEIWNLDFEVFCSMEMLFIPLYKIGFRYLTIYKSDAALLCPHTSSN
jgi:hypothetical protein